jgi:hypothetical protein
VVGLPGDERRDDKTGLRVEMARPERWRAEVRLKDYTMDRQRVAAMEAAQRSVPRCATRPLDRHKRE